MLKQRQIVGKVCVQNIRCGGLVLLISGRVQDLHDREDYAGSTDAKCPARSVTKSRKKVYCQRPGKAGGNKIVKILWDFFNFYYLGSIFRKARYGGYKIERGRVLCHRFFRSQFLRLFQ